MARALVDRAHVLSMTFGADGEWLTVQTAKPDEFYGALHDPAIEAGAASAAVNDPQIKSPARKTNIRMRQSFSRD